jgi:hypothetical protein
MAAEDSELSVEVSLPAEEIVAEARRWELADEVGLRVSEKGATSVVVSSPRGRQFAEHLVSMEQRAKIPSSGERTRLDGHPVLRAVSSGDWLAIVKLAVKIEGDAASRGRIDGAAALRLARAIRALEEDGDDTRASGVVLRRTDSSEDLTPTRM